MFPHRTRLILAALVAAITLIFAVVTDAHAYTLGAADGESQAAPLAAQLGAKTYRLVMDSSQPLDSYAARIEAYRAYGMRPQIVVDGIGTTVRGKTGRNWQTINYAIHAYKRWPDAYSVSVMNEANITGMSACQYADTFRRAYKMLKAAGVKRVLFGEWAPTYAPNPKPLEWTDAVAKCSREPIVADGWAWHCYDVLNWYGIQHTATIRRHLARARSEVRTRTGAALPIYCTEYGAKARGHATVSETRAAAKWSRALAIARKYRLKQIVAWQILPTDERSEWDTRLVDNDGRRRAAFAAIASAR